MVLAIFGQPASAPKDKEVDAALIAGDVFDVVIAARKRHASGPRPPSARPEGRRCSGFPEPKLIEQTRMTHCVMTRPPLAWAPSE